MTLPYTRLKKAKYIADEIRELVEKFSFEDPSTQEKSLQSFITVSLGISSIDLEDVLTEIKDKTEEKRVAIINEVVGGLLKKANYALDYAKFMGKNRVEKFSKYLQIELNNLNYLRTFYFRYSIKAPKKLKDIFEDPYLNKNKFIKSKIKKHFRIIRTEINLKDTRTQALFADNLYRFILKKEKTSKEYFLKFIKSYI